MTSPLRLLGFPYEHSAGRFQGNALFRHILLGPSVVPINKVQMKQGFVVVRKPRVLRGMENAPCALSNVDLSQLKQIHRRHRRCSELIQVLAVV